VGGVGGLFKQHLCRGRRSFPLCASTLTHLPLVRCLVTYSSMAQFQDTNLGKPVDYQETPQLSAHDHRESHRDSSTPPRAVVHSRFSGGFYYPPAGIDWETLRNIPRKCTRCTESSVTCDVPDRGLKPCKQCSDDEALCSLPFLYVFYIHYSLLKMRP
jgi:hypothetical protein